MDTWMIIVIAIVAVLVVAIAIPLAARSSRHRKVEELREEAGRGRDEAQRRHADADRKEADAERHAAKAKVEAALAESEALEARQARSDATNHERLADHVDPDIEVEPEDDARDVDLRDKGTDSERQERAGDSSELDHEHVDRDHLAERIQARERSGRPQP